MTSGGGILGPRLLISLHFPAGPDGVRHALLTVDATLHAEGISDDLRDRTQIALAEACNNIVEHAYCDRQGDNPSITLDVASDRGGIQITLRDKGGPMPNGQLPGAVFPQIADDDPLLWPEGGFGWPILRSMARALSMSRCHGQNILRFRLPGVDDPLQSRQKAM
ncbi:hypothetical protein LSUCC0031_01900 [Rhodobacterales bacterium LSUCC0031]|nr:hypothetical protein [Rhodobacterales bacterium LSUCC0031]